MVSITKTSMWARRSALISILILAAASASARERKSIEPPDIYDFGPDEQVRARIDAPPTHCFVGQPLVVPITLSNHTRHPITLATNMVPRGYLKVTIHRSGRSGRSYYGPYIPGIYAPSDLPMLPLDEVTLKALIWADLKTESGLAFEEPGRYQLEFEVKVEIAEAESREGRIPLGRIDVVVEPTPEALRPMVDALRRHEGAFAAVHRGLFPEGMEEAMPRLVRSVPTNPITPYLLYAMAGRDKVLWTRDKSNRQLADSTLMLLQSVAQSDSVFKLQAWEGTLRFLDELGQARACEAVARTLVEVTPPERLGRIGDHELLIKYLLNTQEVDRSRLWWLLP